MPYKVATTGISRTPTENLKPRPQQHPKKWNYQGLQGTKMEEKNDNDQNFLHPDLMLFQLELLQ